jgi:hypothetical protein
MKKIMVLIIIVLFCVLNGCAVFVYDDDNPTGPNAPDTTTIVIID